MEQPINDSVLSDISGETPIAVSRLPGGDINDVYLVTTTKGKSVVKLNDASLYTGMLAKEAMGLQLLAETETVKIPAVISSGIAGTKQYLVLEHIEAGKPGRSFGEDFGRRLAGLHRHSNEQFGLHSDNYIGSLVQSNTPCRSWGEFLVTQRLEPMIEMAVNQGDINYVEAKIIEPFYARIESIFPEEKPSLLHGDLWSGNYLVSPDGEPVLIDPAVYYGHREMDLAMMHLFGGFPSQLFETYHEVFPLEAGWKERIAYNQLYPLLVHVNLFGRSYWERVKSILDRF